MVMPYLNFTGDCEEAFALYRRAFDAPAPVLARYGGNTQDPALKEKIMHGHIMLTDTGGVSGADATWPVEKGSAVSIHVYCPSVAAAQKAFDVLAEAGTSMGSLAPNPPPHDDGVSGMVVDRYGFSWVLSAEMDDK